MIVVGYTRLSRDDGKRNYVSIENQKQIIQNYADNHDMTIDKFYEDDGISGYMFDRPDFNQMLDGLEKGEIDIVIAKDLSRIGRNNAKVLTLLDKFQDLEKRLILIDDDYDTDSNNDDIVGIKTWYNERYVKDTSKKIRSVLSMKQKEGNYICNAPFGYYVHNKQFYIRENEAEIVRRIFDLYISGNGYRNIANLMNNEGIPTPSTIIMQNMLSEGKEWNKKPSTTWSDARVKDILKNDFYIGVLRTKKRGRKTIHGTDKRIPKSDQYTFMNHHKKIIDEETFNLVQELMAKRKKTNFRGSKLNNDISIFGSVLFCKDCGSKLVRINRTTNKGIRKYYICSKYNYDGKQSCSSHLINEVDLIDYTIGYINVCKDLLKNLIKSFNIQDYKKSKDDTQNKINNVNKAIEELKNRLQSIFTMKLNDMSKYDSNLSLIEETYSKMQDNVLKDIEIREKELKKLQEQYDNSYEQKFENVNDAYQVIRKINHDMTRKDVELIIDKIVVDNQGIPEINLRHNINDYIDYTIYDLIDNKENKIIASVYEIIKEEKRSYTSAKHISARLNEMGINKNKKSVLPYINLAISEGILEKTDDSIKPYSIIVSKDEIDSMINIYTGRW